MIDQDGTDLQRIELSIEEAKKHIEKMNKLIRLSQNADFNELINKEYFETEASRLVLIKADPSMSDESAQKEIEHRMIGVGQFRQYLQFIMQMGRNAERALKADEETRAELLQEGIDA